MRRPEGRNYVGQKGLEGVTQWTVRSNTEDGKVSRIHGTKIDSKGTRSTKSLEFKFK